MEVRPLVASSAKHQLIECIQESAVSLLGTIRTYVQRMGLASGEHAHSVALEVLQEVVMEALDHAESFNVTRQPMAWLLGIAINVIRRKKVEQAKRYGRELSLDRLARSSQEQESEGVMLNQIASPVEDGPEWLIENDEQVNAILSLVSTEDQHVLRLALLEEFERDALARKLGTSYGAARMRLHRSLERLRLAWHKSQEQLAGGNDG